MSNLKLDQASEIAITTCMNVRKREKILVITDERRAEIGYSLYNTARKLGFESLYVEMKVGEMHGQEPPQYIAALMQMFDVVFVPTTKSLTHTEARRNASAKGARVATFPGITKEVMIRGLNADYNQIAKLTIKLQKMMNKTKIIHVTSQNGTDITFDVSTRNAIPSKGLFHKKGESGNLPTGEAYIAPLEGKTNGVFVVDGSMSGVGVIENPIILEVLNGFVTKITGKDEAFRLQDVIKPYGKVATNIAEFGIGTNPTAKLSGNLLEDEKVLGTIHIAIGDNKSMGGLVNAPIHLDGVVKKPTVFFDDKKIMEKGKLLV